jgi:hypothetical protein
MVFLTFQLSDHVFCRSPMLERIFAGTMRSRFGCVIASVPTTLVWFFKQTSSARPPEPKNPLKRYHLPYKHLVLSYDQTMYCESCESCLVTPTLGTSVNKLLTF